MAPPDKICAACGRPFSWRRKWARDWEQVRFCSDACRTGRRERAIAKIAGAMGAKIPGGMGKRRVDLPKASD